MSDSVSPLCKTLSSNSIKPMMSLDYGVSVKSPISLMSNIRNGFGVDDPLLRRRPSSELRASLETSLSSPRVLMGAGVGSPTEVPLPYGVWSDHGHDSDPLASVQQQALILETRAAASAADQRDRQQEREERRRHKTDLEFERIQDLARSLEVDKSKVAKAAFDQFLKTSIDAEDSRIEKWKNHEEECESIKAAYHKREMERERELNTEREKYLDRIKSVERMKLDDSEKERRNHRLILDRLDEVSRRQTEEMQRMWQEIAKDRQERKETRRIIEEKMDQDSHYSDSAGSRENSILAAEISTLRQEKTTLSAQLEEAKEEQKRLARQKEKECDKLRSECDAERRERLSAQERLEREKRSIESQMHQKQQEAETREWKLQHEHDSLKQRMTSEVEKLRSELDEKRKQTLINTNDTVKNDLMRERDRVQNQLRQSQEDFSAKLKDDRERHSAELMSLQHEILALKEKDSATQARLLIDTDRADRLQKEVDELKRVRTTLEGDNRKSTDLIQSQKYELQRTADELATLSRLKQELDTQVTEKNNIIREKDLQIANSSSQVKQVEDTVNTRESTYKKKVEQLNKELDDSLSNSRVQSAALDAEKQRLAAEHARCAKLQESIDRLEGELSTSKNDCGSKERELMELRTKMRQKDVELSSQAELHSEEVAELKRGKDRTVSETTADFNKKIDLLRTEVDRLTTDLSKARSQGTRTADKQTSSLRSEVEDLSEKNRSLTSELEDTKRKLTTAEDSNRKEMADGKNIKDELEAFAVEHREQKKRLDVFDFEQSDMLWIYSTFVTGLLRCNREIVSRVDQKKGSVEDEVERIRSQLHREQNEVSLLKKDIQELQHKLKQAHEDKSTDTRIRDLRRDLERESSQRSSLERETSSLKRDLSDAQDRIQLATTRKIETDKRIAELENDLSAAKRRPASAAAAAGSSTSRSNDVSTSNPPKWLIVRARADIANDRSVERSNGMYELVPGGISEATKDSSGRRANWAFSNCIWERKFPQQRWIYSSKKESWRITDGFRDDGIFDLGSEVDNSSTFDNIFQDKDTHNGVLPHDFKRWCKGITCSIPPNELHVTADKWNSTGCYKMMLDTIINGWPVWELSSPRRWLYNTIDGSWQITDDKRDFDKGGGLVIDAKHNGVLPSLVTWDGGVTVSVFAIDDVVRMRDHETDEWQTGKVSSIRSNGQPLVQRSNQQKGYTWRFVEKPPSGSSTASSGKCKEELEKEISDLKETHETALRRQQELLKSEKSRTEEMEKKLRTADEKIEELEKELKGGGGGGGGSSTSDSDVQRKLRAEIDRRMDAERQVTQFKEASQRNEQILCDLYEEKPKLESRIKELEKQLEKYR
eukprot:TRINITY_DN2080_c1_g1_i3.p1 TRINITY_DN2080_c1_g1~~TRINITY_DN2080_c1_g1_i3.p1  ORF type:complete len:1348 (+),score=382.48 TRINITY_DN2080_c1_g1_i3:90-4133(+)